MVLISLYIKRHEKGEALICDCPNKRCGAYLRVALVKLFLVKMQGLFE